MCTVHSRPARYGNLADARPDGHSSFSKKKDVEELGQQSCSMCVHYVVATRMRLAPKYRDSISLFPIESRGSHSDGNVRQAWFHLRVYTWFNFRRVLSPDVIVC